MQIVYLKLCIESIDVDFLYRFSVIVDFVFLFLAVINPNFVDLALGNKQKYGNGNTY